MNNNRFCIFVPTIRKGIHDFREALFNSLTMPTDVFIADGVDGIIQTYGWALENILDPDRHDWFVKLDDDLILHPGWQWAVTSAFRNLRKLAAVAPDLSDTMEGRDYMGPIKMEYQEAGFELKEPVGNLAGACIVTTAVMALKVGVPPIVEGTKYQFYEDGWRCARIREMGGEIAYLRIKPQPEIVHYEDCEDYKYKRKLDIEASVAAKKLWEVWNK